MEESNDKSAFCQSCQQLKTSFVMVYFHEFKTQMPMCTQCYARILLNE